MVLKLNDKIIIKTFDILILKIMKGHRLISRDWIYFCFIMILCIKTKIIKKLSKTKRFFYFKFFITFFYFQGFTFLSRRQGAIAWGFGVKSLFQCCQSGFGLTLFFSYKLWRTFKNISFNFFSCRWVLNFWPYEKGFILLFKCRLVFCKVSNPKLKWKNFFRPR